MFDSVGAKDNIQKESPRLPKATHKITRWSINIAFGLRWVEEKRKKFAIG